MGKRYIYIIVILFFCTFSGIPPKTIGQFRVKTVVIDPGHGGKDPGNLGTGKFKTYEKDVVLAISLKLGDYIKKNFNEVKIIYTRDKDEFIGLKERADIANKHNADVFICIHANSNESSAPYGTSTYVMGLHKTKENLELAKKENASILMEDDYKAKYEGYDPNAPESDIIFSMYQNAYLEQSIEFAVKVQRQFKEEAKSKDRGVKQAGFLVLYHTTMPSILIETGFLSNKEEEKYLNTEKGQDNVALTIFKAFEQYKIEMEGLTNEDLSQKGHPDNPPDTSGEQHIVFRIQLVTSSNRIPLDSPKFDGLDSIHEYVADGWFKYSVGEEPTLTSAYKLQDTLRAMGFNSAFVVAFNKEERISLQQAIKLLK